MQLVLAHLCKTTTSLGVNASVVSILFGVVFIFCSIYLVLLKKVMKEWEGPDLRLVECHKI